MNRRNRPGFTLLEVLIAMVILSVAVVALIQTASQGLRLLKVSSDHQEAVALGDRLVRAVDSPVEGMDAGQEGQFSWERRVRVVAVPDELSPTGGPSPQLLALSVAVRWGNGRTVGAGALSSRRAPSASSRARGLPYARCLCRMMMPSNTYPPPPWMPVSARCGCVIFAIPLAPGPTAGTRRSRNRFPPPSR